MKKILSICALCVMIVGATSALFAGGVNTNNNLSADYCKTMHRQASTDPDAAFYNPAGTALMQDGLYLDISNQTIWQPMSLNVRGGDASVYAGISRGAYNGNKHAWYYPALYLAYKKDVWAVSLVLSALGGGGSAEFNNGLQMIDVMLNSRIGMGKDINALFVQFAGTAPIGQYVFSKFSGDSAVYYGQANFSYAVIKDKLSLALGARFLLGMNTYDAKIWAPGGASYYGLIPMGSDFHSEQKGTSYGLIVGISAKPIKNLTVGLKGEWNAPLRLAAQSHDDLIVGLVNSGYQDNGRTHMQLPANIAAGVSYTIEGLTISTSFIYSFCQFAQMKQAEKGFTGGIDTGVGLDYTFKDVPLNVGVGYLFSTDGARPSAKNQLNEELDSHSVSLGFSWTFNNVVKLTLAEIYSHYMPANVNEGSTTVLRLIPATMYKESFNTAIGVSAKLF